MFFILNGMVSNKKMQYNSDMIFSKVKKNEFILEGELKVKSVFVTTFMTGKFPET